MLSAVNRTVVGSIPTSRAFNINTITQRKQTMYNDLSEQITKAVMTLLAIAIVVSLVVGGLIGYVIR